MELFSRKIVSRSISSKPDVDLIMDAFKKAYDKRNRPISFMFHSYRGTQYIAFSFRQLSAPLNIVQSFSKQWYPYDNACCECIFKYLKKGKTIAEHITFLTNYKCPSLNTLNAFITQECHMAPLRS